MKQIRKYIVLFLFFFLLMSETVKASDINKSISELVKWCENTGGIIETPQGDETADWYVFGAARYGYKGDYDGYLDELEQYIRKNGLDERKATEYHRMILVVLACGGNPRSFAGRDLVAEGIFARKQKHPLDEQGINGLIFALIALDAGGYEVPEDAVYTRERICKEICEKQLSDGGFALTGEQADADVTAMVLQALAPYREKGEIRETVRQAMMALSDMQLASGGFASGGIENLESSAQVLGALCACGRNPDTDEMFYKNGKSVVDAVLSYQQKDGGFAHEIGGESDWMSGSQALTALIAFKRFEEGKSGIYDLREAGVVSPKEVSRIHFSVILGMVCPGCAIGVFIYAKRKKAKGSF